MNEFEKAFGFYPEPFRIDAGSIRIRPLPEHGERVDTILARDQVDRGWNYAPRGQVGNVTSADFRERPLNARVFPLPKTHVINHATAIRTRRCDITTRMPRRYASSDGREPLSCNAVQNRTGLAPIDL